MDSEMEMNGIFNARTDAPMNMDSWVISSDKRRGYGYGFGTRIDLIIGSGVGGGTACGSGSGFFNGVPDGHGKGIAVGAGDRHGCGRYNDQ